MVARLMLTPKI